VTLSLYSLFFFNSPLLNLEFLCLSKLLMRPGHTSPDARYLGHVSGQYGGCVGFKLLTAVVMKNSIFWDITQYSPLKVNRCFGGESRGFACCLLQSGLLLGLFFDPEDIGAMFLRNVG
jgi:hypothetical protein